MKNESIPQRKLYSFTGTHSVGKTTLLETIKERYPIVQIVSEITRGLQAKGFPINEAGNDETQHQIIQSHVQNVLNAVSGIYFLDRCVLDGYAYTAYLYIKKRVKFSTLLIARDAVAELLSKYDAIFYIPPELPLEKDNVRSEDVEFRQMVDDILSGVIEEFRLPVVTLSGTVEERLEKVLYVTNNFQGFE